MTYRQIEVLFPEYPVQRVCALLGVAPSGYYHYRQHQPSQHTLTDATLLCEIRRIHFESHETYGSPRMHAALQQAGYHVSRKRVERLMREHGIVPHMVKRLRSHSKRNPAHGTAPNLLQQHFVATRPNQVWLSDTTEMHTLQGIWYLATVEDLFSRRIVGWTTASRFTGALVASALRSALSRRHIKPSSPLSLLQHSDQGSQYTSNDYLALLKKYKLRSSMSDVGNCYDNAPMESFFATLKQEWTTGRIYTTSAALDLDLFDFIEAHYNPRRLHSSIGFMTPVAFEEAYWTQLTHQLSLESEMQSLPFQEVVAFHPLQ